jgi:hypothetical protein
VNVVGLGGDRWPGSCEYCDEPAGSGATHLVVQAVYTNCG